MWGSPGHGSPLYVLRCGFRGSVDFTLQNGRRNKNGVVLAYPPLSFRVISSWVLNQPDAIHFGKVATGCLLGLTPQRGSVLHRQRHFQVHGSDVDRLTIHICLTLTHPSAFFVQCVLPGFHSRLSQKRTNGIFRLIYLLSFRFENFFSANFTGRGAGRVVCVGRPTGYAEWLSTVLVLDVPGVSTSAHCFSDPAIRKFPVMRSLRLPPVPTTLHGHLRSFSSRKPANPSDRWYLPVLWPVHAMCRHQVRRHNRQS